MANTNKFMNVLVAGGCGFVGSNICINLKKRNFNVLSVDNISKKYCKLNVQRLKKFKIRNIKVDIANEKELNKIKFKADLIIDCAAEPAVEISFKEPQKVLRNNLITTLNLLNIARKNNSNFIFLSSSRIYPMSISYNYFKSKNKKLYSEKTSTKGVKTIYGFSKYSSEMLIEEFSYLFGINFIINRLGLTSGPWQFGKVEQGLISLWMWRHIKKQKLKYIGFGGTGNQIRDVLDIDDLNDLIYLQIKNMKKIKNQTFCVGGGKKSYFKLKNLTNYCSKITKNKINIAKSSKTSKNDIPYYVTSNSKLKKFYNWQPKFTLFKILEKIYFWMKKNESKLEEYF